MLETIKMLLGIADASKDELINFHISAITQKILNYTGQIALPVELEYIVVELVVTRMKNKNTFSSVKSMDKGDIKFEYHSDELKLYHNDLAKFVTVRII